MYPNQYRVRRTSRWRQKNIQFLCCWITYIGFIIVFFLCRYNGWRRWLLNWFFFRVNLFWTLSLFWFLNLFRSLLYIVSFLKNLKNTKLILFKPFILISNRRCNFLPLPEISELGNITRCDLPRIQILIVWINISSLISLIWVLDLEAICIGNLYCFFWRYVM